MRRPHNTWQVGFSIKNPFRANEKPIYNKILQKRFKFRGNRGFENPLPNNKLNLDDLKKVAKGLGMKVNLNIKKSI